METKTTFTNLLMTDYKPGVCTDLMFRDNSELEPLFAGRERTGGDKISRPVITRRAGGSTIYHTETGNLATPAQRQKTVAEDTVKYLATSKEVSQHLLNLTKMKKLAYLEAVDMLVSEAVDEQRDSMEKHMFANAGYLGTCESADSATVIVFPVGTNMDQFEPGMAVAILLTANGSTGSGVASDIVVSVAEATRKVTITTGVATYGDIDSTYGICALGSITGGTNLTPNSLFDIIAETDLHGVDVGVYTTYKSWIEDVDGPAELDPIQKVIDRLELRRKARLDRIWGHDSTLRKYQFELIDPRTIQQPGSGEMGTGSIYFKGRSKRRKAGEVLPIEALVYANPTDRILFIQDSVIQVYFTSFNEWMADDTGKILHKITGKAGYECDLGSEYQVMSVERYKLGAADNIK